MSVEEALGFDFSSEPCEYFLTRKWACRKCLPCLHRRQQEWVSRLTEELRQHDNNYYLTFTYEDSFLPFDEDGQMCFDSKRIIKLHRDLRKRFQEGRFRNPCYHEIEGSPEFLPLPKDVHFKYYLTSEYGPEESGATQRPHYHAVYYGLGVDIYTAELLFKSLWPDGFIKCLPAWPGSAGYISKYLVKDVTSGDSYNDDTRMSPIAIMSKGLGKSYVQRMESWHHADPSRTFFQYHGDKKVLSRYYKDKLYPKMDGDEPTPYLKYRLAAEAAFQKRTNEVREKYYFLSRDHPEVYKRLLSERNKYFSDLAYNEKQLNSKKHVK